MYNNLFIFVMSSSERGVNSKPSHCSPSINLHTIFALTRDFERIDKSLYNVVCVDGGLSCIFDERLPIYNNVRRF